MLLASKYCPLCHECINTKQYCNTLLALPRPLVPAFDWSVGEVAAAAANAAALRSRTSLKCLPTAGSVLAITPIISTTTATDRPESGRSPKAENMERTYNKR